MQGTYAGLRGNGWALADQALGDSLLFGGPGRSASQQRGTEGEVPVCAPVGDSQRSEDWRIVVWAA